MPPMNLNIIVLDEGDPINSVLKKSKLSCSDRNQIGVTSGSKMAQGDVKGIMRGVNQPREG